MFKKTKDFILDGIWKIQANQLSRSESFLIRPLRIFILSIREFRADQCPLRASALTFYTLLSIVPVLAMIFGIAKGFGLERLLESKIVELSFQQTVMEQMIVFSNNLLKNTQGGVIAGIGVLFLIWSVLKVLTHIEMSFNDIWKVRTARSMIRKFSDYLSLVFVCPLLLILASSITVLVTSQVELMRETSSIIDFFGPALATLLSLAPYVIIWMLLTFLYIFYAKHQNPIVLSAHRSNICRYTLSITSMGLPFFTNRCF